MTAVAVAPTGRAGPREWAGLATLALPTLLLGLDVTVLYLALPTLATDLQPTGTETLWIMDAYGFLIAGFLITMGTLGDRIGRRRLLLIGAVGFGVASVAAAYASSAAMLIAARAALGIAGATLMPSTLALIRNLFEDARQRALAIGVWATMFALGMAGGPLIGGVLLEHFWWGSAFLIAVPVVVLVLVAAPRALPEYRTPQAGRLDPASVALSLAAILPLVYAVKQAAEHGPDAGTALGLLVGAVAAVVFVHRQRRLDDPLLDMGLFTNPAFSAALAVMLVGVVGVGGVMFLVTQYLQLVQGLTPLAAGTWMAVPAGAMFLAAITAPLLARRIRPGFVMAGTLAVSAIGYLFLVRVDSTSDVFLAVGGFALAYLGLGVIAALGTDLVVGAAPPARAGSASAMSETVQELGIAVGVAVLGSLATAAYRGRIGTSIPESLPVDTAETAGDSLSGATSVADQLPDGLLDQAMSAFTSGLNLVAAVAAVGTVGLAALTAVALRQVDPLSSDAGDPPSGPASAAHEPAVAAPPRTSAPTHERTPVQVTDNHPTPVAGAPTLHGCGVRRT